MRYYIDKIKHITSHHARKIGQHIIKHHKKYLLGGFGYALSHFLVAKVFFAKMFLIKFIIVILGFFGMYNLYSTYAQIQKVCVNNVSIVRLIPCEVNFTTIQDAVIYLENQLNIAQDTLYSNINYRAVQDMLNNYCPSSIITKANNDIIKATKSLRSSFSIDNYKKLLVLQKSFDDYKAQTLQFSVISDPSFCQKEYVEYAMLDKIKKEFANTLKRQNLWNLLPNTPYDIISKGKDSITVPALDAMIAAAPKHTLVHIVQNSGRDYQESNYSTSIRNRIMNLVTLGVNNSIQKLIDKNILNSSDVKILDNKINVKYVLGCNATKGYYTVQQSINDKGQIVLTKLQNISLNINICFTYQYIQKLESYIDQITTHELGHYVYYFKDSHPTIFQNICRANKQKTCGNPGFVSPYAVSAPEEDYAESFLHRYLGDSATISIYTGRYYSGNYYTGYYQNQINPIFASKFSYFSHLFIKNLSYISTDILRETFSGDFFVL